MRIELQDSVGRREEIIDEPAWRDSDPPEFYKRQILLPLESPLTISEPQARIFSAQLYRRHAYWVDKYYVTREFGHADYHPTSGWWVYRKVQEE